jgi:16S rRNA (cytosine967-C5)-methyltransferase
VIRRHPEIKWLRSSDQVDAVVQIQAELLETLWPLLATGGMLVYATCSILRRENDQQISRFLKEHADAAVVAPTVDWGTGLTCGRQIMPGEAQMDGFYYALLRKNS